MVTIDSVFVLAGMFILRFGVPVALMVGLVYLLKRLDRHWEEAARLQMPREQGVNELAGVQPSPQPATRRDVPGQQPPFEPSSLTARPLPILVPVAAGKPCWQARHCPAEVLENCPAYQNKEMACWQARLQAEGKMPEACPTCAVFQRYPMM